MNRKSALILGGVLGAFFSTSAIAALNCTASPDCASLGYTMTAADCTDGIKVACPTNTSKVFCKTVQPVTCIVGSILGGDQFCYKDKLPDGVKPVGIVFDTDNKLAVALTDINSSSAMYWLYENGGGHWSSTQSETGYMWGGRMDTGEESPNYRNGMSNAVVRPVVKY